MKVAYAKRDTDKVNEFLGIGNEMTRKKANSMRKTAPKAEETLAEKREKRLAAVAVTDKQANSDKTEHTESGEKKFEKKIEKKS